MAQGPNLEAHGGSTYCAVAALTLLGRLDALGASRMRKLTSWCVKRLDEGFNGRTNKLDDTCYSFWVGATLRMLDPFPRVDEFCAQSAAFVAETQDPLVGGLMKAKDGSHDPLHTYMGLSGMSLANAVPGLEAVNPAVNVTERAMSDL